MEKKPNVEIFVECPHCNAELDIKVFKERVGEKPEPPEYDITTLVVVEKQGRLFDDDKTTEGVEVSGD